MSCSIWQYEAKLWMGWACIARSDSLLEQESGLLPYDPALPFILVEFEGFCIQILIHCFHLQTVIAAQKLGKAPYRQQQAIVLLWRECWTWVREIWVQNSHEVQCHESYCYFSVILIRIEKKRDAQQVEIIMEAS